MAYEVVITASGLFPEAPLGFLGRVGAPDEQGNALLVDTTTEEVRPWDNWHMIHVTGCDIVPFGDYGISAKAGAETSSAALLVKTADQPSGGKCWGDVVGFFNGRTWTAPQGQANIDDAVAAIKTFQNPTLLPGCPVPPCIATRVSVTDVDPRETNRVVNFNDVFSLIRAFQGDGYPFGVPTDPCDQSDLGLDACAGESSTGGGSIPGGSMAGGSMSGGESATASTLSFVPSADLLQQNDLIDVEVFVDAAADLGGYQLAFEISGGSTGSLDLENLLIDNTHQDPSGTPDYVFDSVSSVESVSPFWGQLGAAILAGGGIPVSGPAYLGTFQFRASNDATGIFTIRFADIENNFLMDGEAYKITGTMIGYEAYIGVEVECAIDSHCDDGNLCTDDACTNGTCVYTNNDANTCSDGNDCTDDACSSGVCVSTNDDSNACTDGNDCTSDACVSGVCASTDLPSNTDCDDGLFCTKRDKCDGAGVCVGTGDPCTGQNPECCEQNDTCGPLPCF